MSWSQLAVTFHRARLLQGRWLRDTVWGHGCHRAKVRTRWWFLWQKSSLSTDIKLASSSLSGQNFRCPGLLSWLCETSITFRRNPKQWTSLAHPSFVWGSREAWQLNARFLGCKRTSIGKSTLPRKMYKWWPLYPASGLTAWRLEARSWTWPIPSYYQLDGSNFQTLDSPQVWLCFEAHVETEEEKGKVRQGPFDVDNSFLVVIFKNP